MDAAFIWDDKNIEHLDAHGVAPAAAEYVVAHARHPYPIKEGDGKWLVRGRAPDGGHMQVVFVYADEAGGVDFHEADLLHADDDDLVYVIHAMRLTAKQQHRERRRRK